jgi:hypothetical protein
MKKIKKNNSYTIKYNLVMKIFKPLFKLLLSISTRYFKHFVFDKLKEFTKEFFYYLKNSFFDDW